MLLQALFQNATCHPVLERLELGSNPTWWSEKSDLSTCNLELLCKLILECPRLKELKLAWSYMQGSQLAQVLKAVRTSAASQTIAVLDLRGNCLGEAQAEELATMLE